MAVTRSGALKAYIRKVVLALGRRLTSGEKQIAIEALARGWHPSEIADYIRAMERAG